MTSTTNKPNTAAVVSSFPRRNSPDTLLQSPLVLIGAGRSGSTLLHAMLDAHPAIRMLGEMEWAILRMWESSWNVGAAAGFRSALRRAARSSPDFDDEDGTFAQARAIEEAERDRVGAILRGTLGALYAVPDQVERCWGFKEIWMGAPQGNDWTAYDVIFPRAFFIHLVRDPFTFARSAADWERQPFTRTVLREHLEAWVRYHEVNRARAATGRYQVLTYESLVAEPRSTLGQLLNSVGLAWDDACLVPLATSHLASARRSRFPRDSADVAATVPRLAEYMAEFGYQPPVAEAVPSAMELPAADLTGEVATPLKQDVWRLNAPFVSDGEYGWLAPLHRAPALASWAKEADDLHDPKRSQLRLFENGETLGPPHSLHDLIRSEGGGRYSHWSNGHVLLFSTNDNSNPNRNGRVYTVTISDEA